VQTERVDFQQMLKAGHGYALVASWQDAATAYRHAVSVEPTDAGARVALAMALSHLAEYSEATAQLQQALAIQPHNHLLAKKLADLLVSCGRETEAASLLVSVGDAMQNAGLLDDAVKLWRRSVELDPSDETARKRLLAAYLSISSGAGAKEETRTHTPAEAQDDEPQTVPEEAELAPRTSQAEVDLPANLAIEFAEEAPGAQTRPDPTQQPDESPVGPIAETVDSTASAVEQISDAQEADRGPSVEAPETELMPPEDVSTQETAPAMAPIEKPSVSTHPLVDQESEPAPVAAENRAAAQEDAPQSDEPLGAAAIGSEATAGELDGRRESEVEPAVPLIADEVARDSGSSPTELATKETAQPPLEPASQVMEVEAGGAVLSASSAEAQTGGTEITAASDHAEAEQSQREPLALWRRAEEALAAGKVMASFELQEAAVQSWMSLPPSEDPGGVLMGLPGIDDLAARELLAVPAERREPLLLALARSETLTRSGLFAAAREECERTIVLEPDFLPIQISLARVYEASGRLKAAQAKYAIIAAVYESRGLLDEAQRLREISRVAA
jgi:tetratricopeptide (TPR) repeat protein